MILDTYLKTDFLVVITKEDTQNLKYEIDTPFLKALPNVNSIQIRYNKTKNLI